ncbi:hypothetical protein BP5796_05090 [Coleophoma crateriformis]|uniref:Alpha/beta hydrolase fold-3 domain-containing protein n=1 Tax=Coleophoma crateriformis TaxID=565419 RepID=A0A3D8S260_9HELO|nr:hypothetical protein BP5796_05090 [Coleophoma crateriformis]
MTTLQSHIYKVTNGLSIYLDIYLPTTLTTTSKSSLLYFHAGGLVSYNRKRIYPHIVQACVMRGWPLISVDYRLLPQAKGADVWQDYVDAREFVLNELPRSVKEKYNVEWKGEDVARDLVVVGASAGSYIPFMAAAHSKSLGLQPPKAVLSYYGIPTFSHPLFNKSHVFFEPVVELQVAHFLNEDMQLGETEPHAIFDLSCLNDDGSPNPTYERPKTLRVEGEEPFPRGMLYDYFTEKNLYPSLIGPLDEPFRDGSWSKELTRPKFIMIHGDADVDVPIELQQAIADELGPERARLLVVPGVEHNFDEGLYWDDERLVKIREAWGLLDQVVERGEFGA